MQRFKTSVQDHSLHLINCYMPGKQINYAVTNLVEERNSLRLD